MSMAAFLEALAARSADGVRAALAPEFAGKANGRALDRDGQVRLLESFWEGFPDGAFTVEATGGSGHHVLTWTFAGTHGGVYLGIPPTGTKVTLSGFTIAVSNASGVVSLDWKWDTKAIASQVLGPEDLEGAFPTPPKHRPDPSVRWAREAQRMHRGGKKKGKRKPAEGQGRSGAGSGGQGQGRDRPPRGGRPPRSPAASPDAGADAPASAASEEAAKESADPGGHSPPQPGPQAPSAAHDGEGQPPPPASP